MINNHFYETIESILSPDEIINENIKTQTLNTLRNDLLVQKSNITNDDLLYIKIGYLESSIEDAYKIDMYKFQFKIFTDIIIKEIKNIKDALAI